MFQDLYETVPDQRPFLLGLHPLFFLSDRHKLLIQLFLDFLFCQKIVQQPAEFCTGMETTQLFPEGLQGRQQLFPDAFRILAAAASKRCVPGLSLDLPGVAVIFQHSDLFRLTGSHTRFSQAQQQFRVRLCVLQQSQECMQIYQKRRIAHGFLFVHIIRQCIAFHCRFQNTLIIGHLVGQDGNIPAAQCSILRQHPPDRGTDIVCLFFRRLRLQNVQVGRISCKGQRIPENVLVQPPQFLRLESVRRFAALCFHGNMQLCRQLFQAQHCSLHCFKQGKRCSRRAVNTQGDIHLFAGREQHIQHRILVLGKTFELVQTDNIAQKSILPVCNDSSLGQIGLCIFQTMLGKELVVFLVDFKHIQHFFLEPSVQQRTGRIQLFRLNPIAAELCKHGGQFREKRCLAALSAQETQLFFPFRDGGHCLVQQCHTSQFIRIFSAVRHTTKTLKDRTCQRLKAMGFQLVERLRSEDSV